MGQRNCAADVVGEAGVGEFAEHDFALGVAADDAEIGGVAALAEDFLENWPIGGVAHRHGDDEVVVAELADVGGHVVGADRLELARLGQPGEPVGPRVDAGDVAFELQQAPDECLGDVAGAEDDDAPGAMVVRFEVELHDTAAGHADVALEIPFDEAALRGGAFEHQLFRELDRLLFDLAAADGADHEAARIDEHFGAGILRRAADGFDHGDRDERRSRFGELGQFLDEAVRRRHAGRKRQRSGVGGQTRRICWTTIRAVCLVVRFRRR